MNTKLLLLLLIQPAVTHVAELTPHNLSDALTASASHPLILEFYAPWCGGCRELAPVYERAAELARTDAAWARIDASRYQSVALRFGVSGYPTIFHVFKGELRAVAGGGGAEGLAAFARRGWKGAPPLPRTGALRGPLGASGLVKFYAARPFELAVAALTPAAEAVGLPPVAAQFIVALVAVSGTASAIIAVALCLGPRKRQAPPPVKRR